MSYSECNYKIIGSIQILASLITIGMSIHILYYRNPSFTRIRKYLFVTTQFLTGISLALLFTEVRMCNYKRSVPITLGVMQMLLIFGYLIFLCCLGTCAVTYFTIRWCFYTRGLNKKIIKVLPMYLYKGDNQEIMTDQTQKTILMTPQQNICPICLLKYEINDKIRLLTPPCSHHYHQKCIDEWFKQHTTCPTCRHDFDPAHRPPQNNNTVNVPIDVA
jgi:hypothetical protein